MQRHRGNLPISTRLGRELTKSLLELLAVRTADHVKTAAIRRYDVAALAHDDHGFRVLLQQV